jgi:hypothetical protein
MEALSFFTLLVITQQLVKVPEKPHPFSAFEKGASSPFSFPPQNPR